jgi:hypothetical protein
MARLEEGQWLTYEELAQQLGCTVPAARILAVRRKYPRRIPNAYGERTRVLVPEKLNIPRRRGSRVRNTVRDTVEDTTTVNPVQNGHDPPHVTQALEALREQFRLINGRADRAEQCADEERTLRIAAEKRADAAEVEIRELRVRHDDVRDQIADLRARLDEERAERRQTADQLAAAQERIAALTDQRTAPPPRRSWLPWRRRG